MDQRQVFDRAIEIAGRFSAALQYRDLMIEARKIDRPACGSCYFWMKRGDCPREKGLGSGMGGPSASSPACSKFQIEKWVTDLKAKRLKEAQEFAERHGIPVAAQ